ncbi:hypothetical protein [Corynebacterium singulare]|uniref:hypothetical protein n=1 Tax=Corynebacterium singulare TaxID=161899 RepID=UPI00119D4643|nr:hypothetical protein [Corynebacterium singulare]
MTVAILGLVVATVAWAVWDKERENVEVAAIRHATAFEKCGVSVTSALHQRLVLTVDSPTVYAQCSKQSLTTACSQVLSGPVDLANGQGQVIVTKKK